jgi:hypothetical protein
MTYLNVNIVNIDPQDEKFKLFVLLGVSWPPAKLPNNYLRRLRGKAMFQRQFVKLSKARGSGYDLEIQPHRK